MQFANVKAAQMCHKCCSHLADECLENPSAGVAHTRTRAAAAQVSPVLRQGPDHLTGYLHPQSSERLAVVLVPEQVPVLKAYQPKGC